MNDIVRFWGLRRLVLAPTLLLTVLLLLTALSACGEDGGPTERPSSERETTRKSSEPEATEDGEAAPDATEETDGDGEPEPTRRGVLGVLGQTPEAATEPTAAATGQVLLIPTCPTRQPAASVMAVLAQTSAATDKAALLALLALFEATDGETWDGSGNRSQSLPTPIPAPTPQPGAPQQTPQPVMGTVSGNWGGHAPIGEWAGVATNSQGRVVGLRLSNLTGELPPELGNLASLESLTIGYSELSGELPAELGNLGNLRRLEILESSLTGGMPPEIERLSALAARPRNGWLVKMEPEPDGDHRFGPLRAVAYPLPEHGPSCWE